MLKEIVSSNKLSKKELTKLFLMTILAWSVAGTSAIFLFRDKIHKFFKQYVPEQSLSTEVNGKDEEKIKIDFQNIQITDEQIEIFKDMVEKYNKKYDCKYTQLYIQDTMMGLDLRGEVLANVMPGSDTLTFNADYYFTDKDFRKISLHELFHLIHGNVQFNKIYASADSSTGTITWGLNIKAVTRDTEIELKYLEEGAAEIFAEDFDLNFPSSTNLYKNCTVFIKTMIKENWFTKEDLLECKKQNNALPIIEKILNKKNPSLEEIKNIIVIFNKINEGSVPPDSLAIIEEMRKENIE